MSARESVDLFWPACVFFFVAIYALDIYEKTHSSPPCPTPTAAPVIAAPPHALSPNPLSRP